MSELVAERIFRQAGESIVVLSPPLDGVIAEAQVRRRRRRRTVAVGAAATLVLLASATWLTTRPQPAEPPPEPAAVTASTNPVDIAWYAAGLLHLEDVTVELPQLSDLAEVSTGAVYGDTTGVVGFVRADGERRILGHTSPQAPLVVSTANGWAAWVDPSGDIPELVVQDVYTGKTLPGLELPDGGRLIAIDQARVFYATADGDYSWIPGQQPELQDDSGLVDIESATRAYQRARGIELVQPFFNVSFRVPGVGARLSAGGGFALSAAPGDRSPGDPFEPLLYDVRAGDRLPAGIRPDELAVDASFGRTGAAVYLVGQRADLDSSAVPLLVLRSCIPATSRCVDLAPVPTTEGTALLAQ